MEINAEVFLVIVDGAKHVAEHEESHQSQDEKLELEYSLEIFVTHY
jgi:hypothetical protein